MKFPGPSRSIRFGGLGAPNLDCIGVFVAGDEFKFGAGADSGVVAGGFVRGFCDRLGDRDRHDLRRADSRSFGAGLAEIVGSEQRAEAGGGAEAAGQGRRRRG